MFDQVIHALTSGALFIAGTMILCCFWSAIATMQRSRSRLLEDMEPLFLWVEIQTINGKFANYSRYRALVIVFTTLGFLIWMVLVVITLLLFSLSPELLRFLLSL